MDKQPCDYCDGDGVYINMNGAAVDCPQGCSEPDKQQPVDLDSFEGRKGTLPDEYQSLALIDSPVASGNRSYTAHDIANFVLKAENQAFQYGRITEIKKHHAELRQLRAENEALRNPWVPIDDPIIETWKDGRNVDLLVNTGKGPVRKNDHFFLDGKWVRRTTKIWLNTHTPPTHAMLPPNPPNHTGEA